MKRIFLIASIFTSVVTTAQPGTLSPGFGIGGKVTTAASPGYDEIRSMAIQLDGKIIAAGNSQESPGPKVFSVIRYHTDGRVDSSFGTNGKVAVSIGVGTTDILNSVAIQADGKILLGGYSINGSNYDFAVVRLTTTGGLDNSFDNDGKLTTDISATDILNTIGVQADGKIVATGHSQMPFRYTMVRYNSDGTLDNAFGTNANGIVIAPASTSVDELCRTMTIQADGKIILAGYIRPASTNDIYLTRYNSNGTIDNSFGTNGKLVMDIAATNDGLQYVMVQPDGKIVGVGGSSADFVVIRLSSVGVPDNTFNGNGIVTTNFGAGNEEAIGVALQNDGKLLVGGRNGAEFLAARYLANGTLDNSFDGDGKVSVAIGIGAYTYSMKIFGSRIFLAGSALVSGNGDFALASLENDAAPLPVTIVSFTGKREGSTVRLEWQTAQQINLDRYVVERSFNGSQFVKVGEVAAGNASEHQFTFIDNSPLPSIGYYRLKLVDKDGKFQYSKVVAVKPLPTAQLTVTPNPSRDLIVVHLASEASSIRLLDVSGRLLRTISVKPNETKRVEINIQNLSRGIYAINADDESIMFLKN